MTTLLSLLNDLDMLKLNSVMKLDENKLITTLMTRGADNAAAGLSYLNSILSTNATSVHAVHRSPTMYDTYIVINGYLENVFCLDGSPIHKLPLEFEPHSVAITNRYATKKTFYLLAPTGVLHVIKEEGSEALVELVPTPSLVWRLEYKHATCLDGTVIKLQ